MNNNVLKWNLVLMVRKNFPILVKPWIIFLDTFFTWTIGNKIRLEAIFLPLPQTNWQNKPWHSFEKKVKFESFFHGLWFEKLKLLTLLHNWKINICKTIFVTIVFCVTSENNFLMITTVIVNVQLLHFRYFLCLIVSPLFFTNLAFLSRYIATRYALFYLHGWKDIWFLMEKK